MKATIKEINEIIKKHFADWLCRKLEYFIYQYSPQYVIFNSVLCNQFYKKTNQNLQVLIIDKDTQKTTQMDFYDFLFTEIEENQL